MAKALEEAGGRSRGSSANIITRKVESTRQFYHDVKLEMKRVTWPTRDEVYQTTIVTILVVFFFGYFLWGTNWVLAQVVKRIIAFLSR